MLKRVNRSTKLPELKPLFGLRLLLSRWQLWTRPCAKRFDPPTKWSTMSSGYPALSDERSTPPSIPSQEVACACFCPEKGNSPLLSVQVFGEFCATCVALLCFAMSSRQGPPHRNQEPHKLLCDSQNASHSHLTCGIKTLPAHEEPGWFQERVMMKLIFLCPFHFLVCTRTIGVISRSCCFDWENARHSWHPRVILNNTHTRVSHAFVF